MGTGVNRCYWSLPQECRAQGVGWLPRWAGSEGGRDHGFVICMHTALRPRSTDMHRANSRLGLVFPARGKGQVKSETPQSRGEALTVALERQVP